MDIMKPIFGVGDTTVIIMYSASYIITGSFVGEALI